MANNTEARIRVSVDNKTPEGFRAVERGLREFKTSIDSISGRLDVFAGLKSGLAGLAAVLGGGVLANAFNEAVSAADKLNEVSQKTGIATDALSELKFAAEINNVTFEDLQVGLRKFASALDSSDDAFRRIGLDAKAFNDIDEALLAVADKFAQMRDPIAAAALALDLFGRSGTQLLPLLQQGRAGITQYRDELRKLGGVITTDFAKAADDYKDNITRIGVSWQAVKNELAQDVLPFFARLAEEIVNASKASGGLISGIGRAAVARVPGVPLIDQIRKTESELSELEAKFTELSNAGSSGEFDFAGGIASGLEDLQKKIKGTTADLLILKGLREQEIRADPKLQALAERGKGIRENTNIDRFIVRPLPKKEEADTKSKKSDFDVLHDSLIAKLQKEHDLTLEQELAEDKRFKGLNRHQQETLRLLARRLDFINDEKRATDITNQLQEVVRNETKLEAEIEIDFVVKNKESITREFEDKKISADEYYKFVEESEKSVASIRRELLTEEERRARDLSGDVNLPIKERIKAMGDARKAQADLIKLDQDETAIIERNTHARQITTRELLLQRAEVAQQLNQLRGTQDPGLDKLILREKAKDVPLEIRNTQTFQLLLDTQSAEAQLSSFEKKINQIREELADRETTVKLDFDVGLISSQAEAQQRIVDARKNAVTVISEEIKKVEELRVSNVEAFGPDQEARLRRLKTSLLELRDSSDIFLKSVRDVAESPLSNLLFDLQKGAKSAAEAFKDFGRSIEDALLRKGADKTADLLVGGVGKILGGAGDGQGNATSGALGFAGSLAGNALKAGGNFLGGLFGSRDPLRSAVDSATASQGFGLGSLEDSAQEVSSKLLTMGQSVDASATSADTFGSDLSGVDVAGPLLNLATSSVASNSANQALAASMASASTAVLTFSAAAVKATLALQAASGGAGDGGGILGDIPIGLAKGGMLSNGSIIPFAKGAAFEGMLSGDGIRESPVAKFAVGGVVSRPTIFPMAKGKVGLMGEAGPEAIMPLKRSSGGLAVTGINQDGSKKLLPLMRDSAGNLSVRLPKNLSAFSDGGIFEDGDVSKFALGGVFDFGEVKRFAYGGILDEKTARQYGISTTNITALNSKTVVSNASENKPQSITVVQNIRTDDIDGFRRSRASIANDARQGIGVANR